ncbi:sigma-70 family RNA polymerase sigma factor [Terrimonas sp. NA20]|uniref:Sigma-70 family RNA polymerase sigma factor n=1 Tax=Terrimonas ginsenosidimutans TaxID=2908004 RepID=A0ABS9KSE1_9BACT|nr:sigma-70 family RNA polymerase sigma factor [Terrimonas ginsenosidimutans]MCG2615245.1 sigma-70 family RNA polymerase sigma factor [Terrimonas ginsenosidimutans]
MQDDQYTLLKKIAEGDEPSFRILFDRYHKKVFAHLFGITKSKEVAEELMMDIFVKLWAGRELILDIRDMDAFLKKVGYNKSMDFFRIAARNAKLQKAIEREMEQGTGIPADVRLHDLELKEILRNAARQLSPQRRLVFTLSREEGLTHDEIAQKLNLSRHTVKNHMIEAIKSIKKHLRANDVETYVLVAVFLTK